MSICGYCGTMAFFDADLRLRPPTDDEIAELLADPPTLRIVDRLMDAMGVGLDDGVAMRCGCRIEWRAELFTIVACAPDCVLAHRVIKMAADVGKPYSVIR